MVIVSFPSIANKKLLRVFSLYIFVTLIILAWSNSIYLETASLLKSLSQGATNWDYVQFKVSVDSEDLQQYTNMTCSNDSNWKTSLKYQR